MKPACGNCGNILWDAFCSVCKKTSPICSYCAWKNTAYQRCRTCQVEWVLSEPKTEEEFRLLVLDQREISRTSTSQGKCVTCQSPRWLAPCNMCQKNSVICPKCAFGGGHEERCPHCNIDWTFAVCKTVSAFRLSILSQYKPEPVKVKEECRKPVPVKKPTGSDHAAFGIEQDETFVPLANDRVTKRARVKKPGGNKDVYRKIEALDDVPEMYKKEPERLKALADDPDQKEYNPKEAMTGLAAEDQCLVPGPIVRAGKGLEFYDKNGVPYDVKTPLSPSTGEDWKFNADSAAQTIIEQLTVKVKNQKTDEIQHVRVLLDTSYLDEGDHKALWDSLNEKAKATPEMLEMIIELKVEGL